MLTSKANALTEIVVEKNLSTERVKRRSCLDENQMLIEG